MTALFHENDCNFLCTVIMQECNSLFKRTAGTVADSNSVAVTISIYQSHTHTNTHTKPLSAELKALKPTLKPAGAKKITEAASEIRGAHSSYSKDHMGRKWR